MNQLASQADKKTLFLFKSLGEPFLDPHLCSRKLIRKFIRLLWNPVSLLQTPENLIRTTAKHDWNDFTGFPLWNLNQCGGTIRTHSKERIQQPRAMPNRMLSVLRWPPATTWVVLSQTRSTIEKPPSVFTTWPTMCCFLHEEDKLQSSQWQKCSPGFESPEGLTQWACSSWPGSWEPESTNVQQN